MSLTPSYLPSELSYMDMLSTNIGLIKTHWFSDSVTQSFKSALSTFSFTIVPEKWSFSICLNTPDDESLIPSHSSPFHCGLLQLFMKFFPNFEPKSVTIQPVFTIPQILWGAHNNHTTLRYEDSTGYLSLCVTALQNMREARMSSLSFLLSRLVVLKRKSI